MRMNGEFMLQKNLHYRCIFKPKTIGAWNHLKNRKGIAICKSFDTINRTHSIYDFIPYIDKFRSEKFRHVYRVRQEELEFLDE